MRLVIPYRLDPHQGYELRYCIRAFVKYYPGLSGVCLIGDKPKWYTGEHIPCTDIPNRKEWSIVSKVMRSPYEEFIFSCDDVYPTVPVNSLPNYYSTTLATAKVYGKYIDRTVNTMDVFPDGLFYDIHTPIIVQRSAFIAAHRLCDWEKKEYLSKSVYGNFIGSEVQMDDCKIRPGLPLNPDWPWFSTNGRTALELLPAMYPEKSDYEVKV